MHTGIKGDLEGPRQANSTGLVRETARRHERGGERCASRTSFTLQTGNILYTLVAAFASLHSRCLILSARVGPQRRGASEAKHPGAEDQPWRIPSAQLRAHGFRSSTVSSLISRFLSSSLATFIGPKRIDQRPSVKGSKATSSPPRASLKNIRSPCHEMSPCG
jgi:hypothetical protein